MSNHTVDRLSGGHICDDALNPSGHPGERAGVLIEDADDRSQSLRLPSGGLSCGPGTDHDYIQWRNTRGSAEQPSSASSSGHQVLAGHEDGDAASNGRDRLEDRTTAVRFLDEFPCDRMHSPIANETAKSVASGAREVKETGECAAIADELVLIRVRAVQLHEYIDALPDLRCVETDAGAHCTVVAVFKPSILACTGLD